MRLAILPDFAEEGWPSMDLVADMLLAELEARSPDGMKAQRVLPAYRHRFARVARGELARNADRLINRMIDYPRHARRIAGRFDCFHVCDHSYAHLLLDLPAGCGGVFCHDLDTFRCLLDPQREPRPRWFRAMTRRILRGMQRAAVVFVATETVQSQIVDRQLIDPARLICAPPGVAPEFVPEVVHAESDAPRPQKRRYLLHVGSCIPRKRIDVLLDVFASLRATEDLTLIQVGGEWTDEQRRQIARLRLADVIEQRRNIARTELAALYRRAEVVLITSEAEGFGLPMVEALGCGAAVVASDIEALREVGGDAARYAPVGDVQRFAAQVKCVLREPSRPDEISQRLRRAGRFTWSAHAATIADRYLQLVHSAGSR
jgi:glycosyltransferase involved in cell wall biosynthesis